MNQSERRKAIYEWMKLHTEEQLRNALEWVGNEMPLFYGDEEVRSSWVSYAGDP